MREVPPEFRDDAQQPWPARLFFLIFLGFSLAIGAIGLFTLRAQMASARVSVQQDLDTIGALKAAQIETWVKERTGDADVLLKSPWLSRAVMRLQADAPTLAVRAELRGMMETLAEDYHYSRILLLDGKQEVLLAVPPENPWVEPVVRGCAAQAFHTNQVIMADLHRCPIDVDTVHMNFLVPIASAGETGKTSVPIAVLVMEVSPDDFLYPLIQAWPTPSPSGETLLVRRDGDDVLFLNPLRRCTNAALTFRLPLEGHADVPAVMAVMGRQGVVEGRDYRGAMVLANIRPVRGTPWHIVAKVDREEIYAGLRRNAWNTSAWILVLLMSAAMGIGLVWRQDKLRHLRAQLAAERGRQDAQAQFQAIVESTPVGIHMYHLEPDGRLLFDGCNPAAQQILGIDHGSRVGLVVDEAFPGLKGTEIPAAYRRIAAEGGIWHTETVNYEDRQIRGAFEVNAFRTEPGKTVVMFNDVTARKRAEAEARERADELNRFFDVTVDLLCTADTRGYFRRVSAEWERALGYPKAELEGRRFLDLVHPDDLPATLAAIDALKGQTRVLNFVNRYRHRSGAYRWLEWRAYPSGELIYAAARDITERKQADEEREHLLAELAAKNKELEGLVYAASHDLRTPLVNIQGFSRRLEKIVGEWRALLGGAVSLEELKERSAPLVDGRIPESLRFISASVTKMDALIGGLLQLSRLGRIALRPEPLDMNRILETILASMSYVLQKAGATVEVDPLPPCRGDNTQINQVFSNLLDNAVKHRDPARPLRVHVTGRQEGHDVVYTVADTGKGIAADALEKIWELFYRQNPVPGAEGEGLGLTLVRRIVGRHNGVAWVESVPGEGSWFFVRLPAVANEAETGRARQASGGGS